MPDYTLQRSISKRVLERSMYTQYVLKVDAVCKKFGDFVALRNASISIPEGVLQGIIGPNGAGKTTLVNVISGLSKPNAGKIHLAGKDVTGASAHNIARQGLIRTSQITSLFGALTVFDNIDVALVARQKYRMKGLGVVDEHVSPDEMIELVGLQSVRDSRVDNLSHGDQRLLEIAVALSAAPQVLLLDEPTAGMSPLETSRFIDLMNQRLKVRYTIILIEHDMKVVMELADCISVLHHGEVIADGSPSEVMANSFVQEAYLGRA